MNHQITRGWSIADKLAFHSMPEPNSGCHLWLGSIRAGYGTIRIDGRTQSAHRVAWELVNGPMPVGRLACHKCDVRSCVNPDHIFPGTQQDNISDMWRKGRGPKDACGNRKLTPRQVLEIIADERSHTLVAADFGIGPSAVGRLRARKTYKFIERPVCRRRNKYGPV